MDVVIEAHLLIVSDKTAELVTGAKSTLPDSIVKKIVTAESPAYKN